MLFPKDRLAFTPDWAPERAVRLGEAMASLAAPAPADSASA
jgi:phosphatidylserine decarboxylase